MNGPGTNGTKQDKLKAIKEAMIEWREEHGASVYITMEQLSEKTDIPVSELHDPDNFKGLCDELKDGGFLVRTEMPGQAPLWQIDGMAVRYDGF